MQSLFLYNVQSGMANHGSNNALDHIPSAHNQPNNAAEANNAPNSDEEDVFGHGGGVD